MNRILASALRAFVGSAIVVLGGLSAVTDVSSGKALAITAMVAGGAAALRFLQTQIPSLTTARLLAKFGLEAQASIVDSAVRAILSSFVVFVTGVLSAPTLSWDQAAWSAAVLAAVTAGIRVLEGFVTKGDPISDTSLPT